MMLMVTKDFNGKRVFLCEESRINTINGMKIKFVDAWRSDNKMRYIPVLTFTKKADWLIFAYRQVISNLAIFMGRKQ